MCVCVRLKYENCSFMSNNDGGVVSALDKYTNIYSGAAGVKNYNIAFTGDF